MAETTLPKLLVSREEARQKIEEQIEKGQQLRDQEIRSEDELSQARNKHRNWSDYNKTLLSSLFTSSLADEYDRLCERPYGTSSRITSSDLEEEVDFYVSPSIMSTAPLRKHEKNQFSKDLDSYRKNMDDYINHLRRICERLELYNEPSDAPQRTSGDEGVSDAPQSTFGDKVFIIHGRDDGAKSDVALFVRDLGLREIILDRQPNEGLIAILDKFEREAKKAGFAIALLTPDDVGALKGEAAEQLKPRARQNVIFELGYFMGKLGRKKVCLLIKGELENPSDLSGILYVPMDNFDGWKQKLATEMRQVGLPIDLNELAQG